MPFVNPSFLEKNVTSGRCSKHSRHFVIDTIVGENNKGAILTIVERKSAFLLMTKLNGKNADELTISTIRLLAPYKDKVHTIISDNGTEFARHQRIAKKLEAKIFFSSILFMGKRPQRIH